MDTKKKKLLASYWIILVSVVRSWLPLSENLECLFQEITLKLDNHKLQLQLAVNVSQMEVSPIDRSNTSEDLQIVTYYCTTICMLSTPFKFTSDGINGVDRFTGWPWKRLLTRIISIVNAFLAFIDHVLFLFFFFFVIIVFLLGWKSRIGERDERRARPGWGNRDGRERQPTDVPEPAVLHRHVRQLGRGRPRDAGQWFVSNTNPPCYLVSTWRELRRFQRRFSSARTFP